MRRVNNDGDTMLLEFIGRANTSDHEELWAFKNPLREDDLTVSVEVELSTRRVNDSHALTSLAGVKD